MKIENKVKNTVEFQNLHIGDVFMFNAKYLMVTDTDRLVVDLRDGACYYPEDLGIDGYDEVPKVECTLLVE